ncbi:DNA binding protein vP5 [Microviridae sp.]|nr:DNA binding protein vP5 [Microviridae sp.]
MSKMIVIAARDSAIGAFGRPVFSPSVGSAVRSFVDEVNRKSEDNAFNAHPEDFDLHLLAEFDDTTGEFMLPEDGRRVLARAKDVKRE